MCWEVALYSFIYLSFISWKHIPKQTPRKTLLLWGLWARYSHCLGPICRGGPYVDPQVKGQVQTPVAGQTSEDPPPRISRITSSSWTLCGPARTYGGQGSLGQVAVFPNSSCLARTRGKANAAQAVYASPPGWEAAFQHPDV